MPSGYTGSLNWYTGTADIAQASHIYALVNNISGYSSAWGSQMFNGPYYPTLCSTANQYEAFCYINSNGSLNALLVFQSPLSPNAGCNNH
ncbi:hypothetical protein [Paraburkholderia sp. BR10872]|uniref:hypothetical protein n=1 Tax=Paraburkholderia sp. BR10872 TaxID=3236989 RepID=UPI0034D1CDAD